MRHASTKILVAVLIIAAILSGYNYFNKPFLRRFNQTQQQTETDPSPTPDPSEEILRELSPTEKILQMIAAPVVLGEVTASDSTDVVWIEQNNPGLVTLFGSNLTADEVTEFVSVLRSQSHLYQPLIAVDHEGGSVQRLRGTGFTALPSWRQNCTEESGARLEMFGQSATELSQAGIQVVFAPVVDVARPGSFIGNRACETSAETINAATDYLTSFANQGILSVLKHYPGIGSLAADPHFELATVTVEAQDTSPFNQLLLSYPNLGVMTAHVTVEGRADETPCSLSEVCLDPFPIHFPEALLITDALEMAAAKTSTAGEELSLEEIAEQAVEAGNHVLVFGERVSTADLDEVITGLVERYEIDETFEQKVNSAVAKILSLKQPQEAR